MAAKIQVAILGAGRMADVLLRVFQASGAAELKLWGRSDISRGLFQERHPGVAVTGDLEAATARAELVFFAVPAPALEAVAEQYGAFARGDQIVAHASRGVGANFTLPHQLIRSKTCVRKIAAIGGPLHSRELGNGRVLPAAIASRFSESIELIRQLTANTPVRIHASHDVVGVEVAGAISNVSAIAAGIGEALGLGETSHGMLLARGLAEAQRIGLALGAEPQTFAGIAGVGDLIPRRVSSTDRHRELGGRLAQGGRLEDKDATLEGPITAREAARAAARLRLKLPLIEAVAAILAGEVNAKATLEAVLRLDLDDLVTAQRRA